MCIFVKTNKKDMKKILYVIAAATLLLAVGCKKEKVDPVLPSVTWAGNPSFGLAELTKNLDAVLTVSAPGKFQDLKLVLGLGSYNILANPHISIPANKGGNTNPVLDLVEDASSVSFANGLGMSVGKSLQDKSEAKLNLKAILEDILKGQVVENNTTFSLEVRVTDRNGKTVSKTAKIHFTAAPAITWAKNAGFDAVDLYATEIECKVGVWAPGKIEKMTLTLGADAAPFLKTYVSNRISGTGSTDGELVIDLIGDSKVVDSFKGWFPAGNAVNGMEQITLDFGFMYGMKYDLEVSSNTFTIDVVDKNGKETIQKVVFRKN